VCVLVALIYLVTLFYPQWLSVFGVQVQWLSNAQFWVIAIPLFIAFTAVMGIGAWIGWIMATTPAPKPNRRDKRNRDRRMRRNEKWQVRKTEKTSQSA
jgi:hypothetical protein